MSCTWKMATWLASRHASPSCARLVPDHVDGVTGPLLHGRRTRVAVRDDVALRVDVSRPGQAERRRARRGGRPHVAEGADRRARRRFDGDGDVGSADAAQVAVGEAPATQSREVRIVELGPPIAAQRRRQPHLDPAERLDRAPGTGEVLLDEVVALVEWEPRVELDAHDLEPVIRDDAGAVGRPAGEDAVAARRVGEERRRALGGVGGRIDRSRCSRRSPPAPQMSPRSGASNQLVRARPPSTTNAAPVT